MDSDALKNKKLQFLFVFVIGIILGFGAFPYKKIEEKTIQKYTTEINKIKQENSKKNSELEEQLNIKKQELSEYKKESNLKLDKAKEEIRNLKSKQKTSYYKIVRPDGTIEIKKYTELDVDESTKVIEQIKEEFDTKLTEIEQKWEQTHEERVSKLQEEFTAKEYEYIKEIKRLEKSKVTIFSDSRVMIDAGMLTTQQYYGHIATNLWGPIVLGFHSQIGSNDSAFGIGIGLRF